MTKAMSTVEGTPGFESGARESACPVHFVWDGRGVGRPLVRAGFVGFLATGALATAAVMLHGTSSWADEVRTATGWTLVASLAVWLAGQGVSIVARRLR
jgi:hypothetical protein